MSIAYSDSAKSKSVDADQPASEEQGDQLLHFFSIQFVNLILYFYKLANRLKNLK